MATITTQSHPEKDAFPFFKLPPELRNTIYEMVVQDEPRARITIYARLANPKEMRQSVVKRRHHVLLFVSKTMHAEYAPIAYAKVGRGMVDFKIIQEHVTHLKLVVPEIMVQKLEDIFLEITRWSIGRARGLEVASLAPFSRKGDVVSVAAGFLSRMTNLRAMMLHYEIMDKAEGHEYQALADLANSMLDGPRCDEEFIFSHLLLRPDQSWTSPSLHQGDRPEEGW